MPIINWFDAIDIEEVGRAFTVAAKDRFLRQRGFDFARYLRFKIDVPPHGPIRGFVMTCSRDDTPYYDDAKMVLEASYGSLLRDELVASRNTWRSS